MQSATQDVGTVASEAATIPGGAPTAGEGVVTNASGTTTVDRAASVVCGSFTRGGGGATNSDLSFCNPPPDGPATASLAILHRHVAD